MTLRLMRSIALSAALGLVALPALAQSPTPSAMATAREVMVITQTAAQFEAILPAMMRQIQVQLTSNNLLIAGDKKAQGDLIEVSRQVEAELLGERAALLDDIAKIYTQRYTEAELKEILAFFKSAAGQKFVSMAPTMIRESTQAAEAWGGRNGPKAAERIRAEMKKRGHQL